MAAVVHRGPLLLDTAKDDQTAPTEGALVYFFGPDDVLVRETTTDATGRADCAACTAGGAIVVALSLQLKPLNTTVQDLYSFLGLPPGATVPVGAPSRPAVVAVTLQAGYPGAISHSVTAGCNDERPLFVGVQRDIAFGACADDEGKGSVLFTARAGSGRPLAYATYRDVAASSSITVGKGDWIVAPTDKATVEVAGGAPQFIAAAQLSARYVSRRGVFASASYGGVSAGSIDIELLPDGFADWLDVDLVTADLGRRYRVAPATSISLDGAAPSPSLTTATLAGVADGQPTLASDAVMSQATFAGVAIQWTGPALVGSWIIISPSGAFVHPQLPSSAGNSLPDATATIRQPALHLGRATWLTYETYVVSGGATAMPEGAPLFAPSFSDEPGVYTWSSHPLDRPGQ